MAEDRSNRILRLLSLVVLPCAFYAVLYATITWTAILDGPLSTIDDAGLEPRVAASLLPFLLLPAGLLLAFGGSDLFEMRRGWLWPLAFYAAVAALALAFYPSNRGFFSGFEHRLWSGDFAIWSVFMAFQVMPVDFFTKRVVQRELSEAAGPTAGQAGQFAAWMAAHVFEFFWLVPLWGPWGSLAFLAATGLASGFIYARGGSAASFMVGHWLCNVAIAAVVSL